MTKQTEGKKNPLYKIAERIARNKAEIIDSQIIPFIPKWQLKLLMAFRTPILGNIFGYTVNIDHSFDLDTYTLKRYGKVLNKFIIKQR